jgi:signal peptidase II
MPEARTRRSSDESGEATQPIGRSLHWGWVVLALVLADQALKYQVAQSFELGERLRLFPGMYITRAHNTGAAFSFLHDGGGWQRWLFVVLALGVSIAIVIWLRQQRRAPALLRAGLVLILAGALGNLIDRVAWGYVIDFVLVYLGNWPFPAFNLADSAISIGAVLVVLDGLFPGAPPGTRTGL